MALTAVILPVPLSRTRLFAFWAACQLGLAFAPAAAAGPAPSQPVSAPATSSRNPELSLNDWLLRMHEASRLRSYVGTFVVSSKGGALSSARIWHACNGREQVERVESLTGAPRSTFRRDDEVLTFLPMSRLVLSEKRESLNLFPNLLKTIGASIPQFYVAREVGSGRVAGFDADVVQLVPKDKLRFGYRIWSEKTTGLVIKLQTLDTDGNVLEQAAFSELQLDAGLGMDKLSQLMAIPRGWRVERAEAVKTSAEAEGWTLKSAVAGFKPMSCYKRSAEGAVQCTFSDGLASVSVFAEAYDRQRHAQDSLFVAGATHTLTRHVQDWWLTAVGEVPPSTLKAFLLNLERRN